MCLGEVNVRLTLINSDMTDLITEFIAGCMFTEELSDTVLGNIALGKNRTYIEILTHIKDILNNSKITLYNDLVLIKTPYNLIHDDERATLVRYVNICLAKHKRIIMYNTEILYLPNTYRSFNYPYIQKYVNEVYNSYRDQRETIYIMKKYNLYGIYRYLKYILKN